MFSREVAYVDARNFRIALSFELLRGAGFDLLRSAYRGEVRKFVRGLGGNQHLHFFFKYVDAACPDVFGVNAPIAADQEGGGHTENAPVERAKTIVAHGHRIVHFELLVELHHRLRAVVHGNPDDGKTLVAVTVLKLDEAGNLDPAGAAPGGPEI